MREFAMNEAEIIGLNVERFRRMLRSEAEKSARQAIQQLLKEFEAKLLSARPEPSRLHNFIPIKLDRGERSHLPIENRHRSN
jgi:hypothetical protein